jgi:peroxiredoxin
MINFSNNKVVPFIIILIVYSCSAPENETKENIDLDINFNTSSTIILHYKNVKDSIVFETEFYNFFPSDVIENKLILRNENGTEQLTFNIQHPQKLEFGFEDFYTTCFLVPNDTLEVYLDFNSTKNIKKNIKYHGKYAPISDYYKTKELHFDKSDFNHPKAIAFNMAKTIADYTTTIDSLTQDELEYINNYPNKKLLPNWFVDYEVNEIKSSTAKSKIDIIRYRRYFLKQDIIIPNNYYKDISEFMSNCPNSILSHQYPYYLLSYFQHIEPHLINPPDTISNKDYHKMLINLSLKNLDKQTSDIFLTFYLDMIIEQNKLNNEAYSLYYDTINDNQLKAYLDDRKENAIKLKPGDNSPPFFLPDMNGKKWELKDFIGNVVYISFWYPGCKPCLMEFPDENKLSEKFKNKKVKIINICTNSTMESWKLASEKYDLKTINLYANDTLDDFIEKNYDINSYPQHVLIDQNGKIIQNKCAKPNKIENEINLLLKK